MHYLQWLTVPTNTDYIISSGAVATWYTLPIAGAVLILLAALIMSYRQIIYAYPKGGGAYMVSKTNLGEKWGLLAGGSLLVDYILTVAVSISSGADAFVAAFPSLYGHKVLIGRMLNLLFILILNLRLLDAMILSYPVYLFIIGLVILIFIGTFRVARRYSTTYACISRNCGSWNNIILAY